MYAYGAKEVSEINRYNILLNVLRLIYLYCGCRMCWWYTLILSLSLVFPALVPAIYSSLHMAQMRGYIKLKISQVKQFFNLKVIWTFLKVLWSLWSFIKRYLQHSYLLSLQSKVPDKTSPNSTSVKNRIRRSLTIATIVICFHNLLNMF